MAKDGIYLIFDKKNGKCISIHENEESNKEGDIILYTKLSRAKKMLKIAKKQIASNTDFNPYELVIMNAEVEAIGEI